jgi:hypothetical protein
MDCKTYCHVRKDVLVYDEGDEARVCEDECKKGKYSVGTMQVVNGDDAEAEKTFRGEWKAQEDMCGAAIHMRRKNLLLKLGPACDPSDWESPGPRGCEFCAPQESEDGKRGRFEPAYLMKAPPIICHHL